MNPSFFGLNGHPFRDDDAGVEPFFADAYESLTTELNAGLKAPHGITLLIGEEGAGKTTFIRAFAERQSDNCTVAYLPTTGPGLRHLLTEVVEQLGGSVAPGANEQVLLESLRGLAKARAEHDRTTLVIIDDAHELPSKTIERLGRLFGNDPAEPSKLHVTLVGRPELLDRMNAANDRSILKHLIQVCRMDAIGPEDAFRYIADRVQKVGGLVEQVFTEEALKLIVQRSNGIPAKIDAICAAAMDEAEDHGEASVGADTVDRACEDADGFPVEESLVKDDDSESTSYFLGDDYNQDEPVAAAPAADTAAEGAHPAPVFERVPAESGNRRRLIVWALGFIGVVAAVAAMLSGGGEEAAIDAAAVDKASEGLVIARNDAVTGGVAESGPLPADPLAVPKLVVNRDTANSQNGPAKAKDRAAARERERKAQGGKREGKAAQASPTDAPRPRVAAPKFEPKAATPPAAPAAVAQAPAAPKPPAANDSLQAAAQAAADQQAPAVVKTIQPPPPAAAPKPKPALGKPIAAPAPKPAPKPAPAAAKPAAPAAKPATPAAVSKPIPPTRPAAAPAPKAPARVAAAPATAAVGKTYTVQIGAFSSRGNAETALAKLKKSYPDGRIMPVAANGKTVFRVVSGNFPSVPAANTRASALKRAGFNTYVRAGN